MLHAGELEELGDGPAVGAAGLFGDRYIDEGSGTPRVKSPQSDFTTAEDFRGQCFCRQWAGDTQGAFNEQNRANDDLPGLDSQEYCS